MQWKDLAPFVLLGPLSFATYACQAAVDGGAGGSGGSGSGSDDAGSGPDDVATSGLGGSGQGAGGSSSSLDLGEVGSSDGAGTGSGGACAATSVQAELLPLDIVFVLDKSGSMDGPSWGTVATALKTFVADPSNAGMSVGVVYFPNEQPDDCNYIDYEHLDVDIGELPGNVPALFASIDGVWPGGGTPTYGALKGALFRATSYQDAHTDHKVVAILASDGAPTSCGITDIPEIAALAASARGYDGVQTYAIAMPGADLWSLDQIAAAGGTGQAYDVSGSVQEFSQKMKQIRGTALPCELVIPPPPDGQTLDPKRVNVSYTPGGAAALQTLPAADGSADCGAGPGWYYDDPASPTRIILCPGSCQAVQADPLAELDVAFGCETILN